MKRFLCNKCYVTLVMSVFLLFGCASQNTGLGNFGAGDASNGKNTIVINYQRDDGDYLGWDVWLWEDGGDGSAYDFTGETEFGKELVLHHKFTSKKIGFIIRKGEWDEKDTDGDRFFTLSDNGSSEIFVLSGEENFAISEKEVKEMNAPRIDCANIIDTNVFEIVFNNKDAYYEGFFDTIVLEEITSEGAKEVAIKTTQKVTDSKYKIITDEKLNYDSSYRVTSKDMGAVFAVLSTRLFDSEEFINTLTYDGELGALYSKDSTTFRVWAPFASKMILNLYPTGDKSVAQDTLAMKRIEGGAWELTVEGNLDGNYYTYSVTNYGKTSEVVDPYARSAGVNGNRSMVIDLSKSAISDSFVVGKNEKDFSQTDAIIYELHVRDMSIAKDSGIENKGKYLAFTEVGTKNSHGDLTGISHIKELGANYIHLLPVYDYMTVDETKCVAYNWGYDPYNYNVPEGSYSTNPYDGEVRVKEFKEMVQSIHSQDMGVIMDVVYNHTSKSIDSHFNLLVPNYYYRTKWDGSFSNGSGCGNEIATERKMVRKYIVESVAYWAEEYNIDGFRFDLMGVYDVDTMNAIRARLDEINPNILMYGEGWDAGGVLQGQWIPAKKANTRLLDTRIAAFSDNIRDGLKGSVFSSTEPAYVNGEGDKKNSVVFGITASTIGVKGISAWATEPTQTITYVSAHDNNTLFDKIQLTNPNASLKDKIAMNNLASAITLTSQGVAFIHAGEELLRTKVLKNGSLDHNSYKSSDDVNKLDYNRKSEYDQVFNYYKGLVSLRNTFDEFRYSTTAEIEKNISFIETGDNMIVYTLADKFVIIFNPYNESKTVTLPNGTYRYYVDKETSGSTPFGKSVSGKITVAPISATVLGL